MQSPTPDLARRRRLTASVIAAAALATLATIASVTEIGLLPPKVELRQLQHAGAVTHAALRLPSKKRPRTLTDFESQARRATLIANLMTSRPVLEGIARRMALDPDRVTATTEVMESVSRAFIEPDNEHRAHEILVAGRPYKLEIQVRPSLPILDIYSQAPTVAGAEDLANQSVGAANDFLRHIARRVGAPGQPVRLAQLGSARGEVLNSRASMMIASLTFVVVFAIAFGLLVLVAEVRRGWLQAGNGPEGRIALFGRNGRRPGPPEDDAWPHTNRILPWMVAGFITMLWLLPINAITIQASLPVDLKLDRLVLPIVLITWLLSMAAGGPGAPRWRFTTIHAGVAMFVGAAFLSVVVNAPGLNQLLELDLAIKKLTLLAAFFCVFLIVASVVRPSEVRPFMTLTLVLSVICALGILWEYRFETNLFYTWSGKLLPGFFQVTPLDTSGYDEIGRRAIAGPADLSLEAVAMLSMALPIALIRVMHSNRPVERLLCGLGVCLLLGAMIATYRKSALLAPLSVFLILAYFRRRELLRLAPLGVVIILAIPALAPNALGSVLEQFQSNRLGVSTVSERVSDYDAIRPDLLSHLALGRGFGSYEHTTYRILDNDLLMRVVETGLVGLIAYVLMIVIAMATGAPIVRGRNPSRAPPALAVVAAAGAFLVLSVLFDIMSFPHAPYILMIMLGLLAVIVAAPEEPAPPEPQLTVVLSDEPLPVGPENGRPADSEPVPV